MLQHLSSPTMVRVDGHLLNAQVVICHDCQKTKETFTNQKRTGRLPDEFLKKKLLNLGWTVKGHRATCPSCIALRRATVRVIEAEQVPIRTQQLPPPPRPTFQEVAAYVNRGQTFGPASEGHSIIEAIATPEPKEAPVAEPIRTLTNLGQATAIKMNPDAKRKIFRAIDDVWDETVKRYLGNNSDELLARDLNVPRAWIEQVRVEAFGDSGANQDIDELKAELDENIKDTDKLRDDALRLAEAFEGQANDLRDMRRRLERVEANVLPRRGSP